MYAITHPNYKAIKLLSIVTYLQRRKLNIIVQCDVVNFKMISHQDEDEVDGGVGRGGVEGKDENEDKNEWRGKT